MDTIILLLALFFILINDSRRRNAKVKAQYLEYNHDFAFWSIYFCVQILLMGATVSGHFYLQYILMLCMGMLLTYYFVDFWFKLRG